MRRIQSTYFLEPAGSHGVWSLDDYMFLPFYFGAAQLVPHERLRPKHALLAETRETYNDDYMFMTAIEFIHRMKTGPFFEHSPILFDIMKGVPRWFKVNSGMLKMYKVEVLGKFPIMQHFLFGSLLPFVPDSTLPPSCQGMMTPMGIAPVLDGGVVTRRPPLGATTAYPGGGPPATVYPHTGLGTIAYPQGAARLSPGAMPPTGAMPPHTGIQPPMGVMPPRQQRP
jgi:Phosphotyrosyl phosphate activator (PTPA) protein